MARRRRVSWLTGLVLTAAVVAVLGDDAGWWSSATAPPAPASSPAVGDALDLGVDAIDEVAASPIEASPGRSVVDRLLGPDLDPDRDCRPPPDADGPEGPVVVGVATDEALGPVLGGDADAIPEVVIAAQRTASAVNCGGGVAGRTVEIVAVGAGGSPLATGESIGWLLDRRPVVIVGPASLEVALRMDAAVDGRVPVVFGRTADPSLDDPAGARVLLGPDAVSLGVAGAAHGLEVGWTSAVVVVDEGAGSVAELAAGSFGAAFDAGGGAVVAAASVALDDEGRVDVDGLLDVLQPESAVRQPADAVVVAGGLDVVASVRAALVELEIEAPVAGLDLRSGSGVDLRALDAVTVVGWPEGSTSDAAGVSDDRPRSVSEAFGVAERIELLADALGRDRRGEISDPVAAARTVDAILVALAAVATSADDPDVSVTEALVAGSATGLLGEVGAWSADDGGPPPAVPVVRLDGGVVTPLGSVRVPAR